MNLIIVESPTKAKTIKQFLGKGFLVESSFGHMRDLPKSNLGIDIENDFQPKYIIIPKAKKIVAELKEKAKKSNEVILATDEDREGEAIAFHLAETLKLKDPKRIVFHEITKSAIENALKNPRSIDMNLVDAQQARRILDRLVGYKLSPLLWKKIARGLSAGRVQSVAVRLIVEKQREIDGFKPEEYWSIDAEFEKGFLATLNKINDKIIEKLGIKTEQDTKEIINDLKDAEYKIKDIEQKEIKKYPFPPFTTSTLQQEASRKLRLSAKQTMLFAQQLYENGLITYMRTDSLNLATPAVSGVRNLIENNFGKNYLPEKPIFYKTKSKGAQEAHEAIRPTLPDKKPEDIKEQLDGHQYKLYKLIWERTIACQMTPAIFNSTSIDIGTSKSKKNHIYGFKANGNTMKFDGFLKVWPTQTEDKILPELKKNETLELIKLIPSQHFTQPPAPYTEATLIKTLEEDGIGRPSTYAPTLDTIQKRGYVVRKIKYLHPTEIGILVNDLLVENFPQIVDIEFTAKMEEEFDKIAEGETKWVPMIRNFYVPFAKNLEEKYGSIDKKELTEEKTDQVCEKCGSPMIIKTGRFGKFMACSNFPKCRNAKPIKSDIGIKCPKCKTGDVVERKTRRGKFFYGCSNYPKCDFALWDRPTGENCPKCSSPLVKTRFDKVKCSNKECDYTKEPA